MQIESLHRPGREAMHGEGMAQLVRARSGSAARWLHPQLTQQTAQRLRGRFDRQWRRVQPQEERRWVGTVSDQTLTRLRVAAQLCHQVIADRHDA